MTSVGMPVGQVEVRAHDPEWAREFTRVEAELRSILPDWILSIDHVGSTSVPGLAAKPILDVLIGVPDFERGLELVPALVAAGFQYRPKDTLPDRHYFPRTVDGWRLHHVSVAEPDSRHARNSLVFRDALRRDPVLAARYAELKRRLARDVGSVGLAYMNGKTDFVLGVLREEGMDLRGDYPTRDLPSSAP